MKGSESDRMAALSLNPRRAVGGSVGFVRRPKRSEPVGHRGSGSVSVVGRRRRRRLKVFACRAHGGRFEWTRYAIANARPWAAFGVEPKRRREEQRRRCPSAPSSRAATIHHLSFRSNECPRPIARQARFHCTCSKRDTERPGRRKDRAPSAAAQPTIESGVVRFARGVMARGMLDSEATSEITHGYDTSISSRPEFDGLDHHRCHAARAARGDGHLRLLTFALIITVKVPRSAVSGIVVANARAIVMIQARRVGASDEPA
jgi:hypothetical protein